MKHLENRILELNNNHLVVITKIINNHKVGYEIITKENNTVINQYCYLENGCVYKDNMEFKNYDKSKLMYKFYENIFYNCKIN